MAEPLPQPNLAPSTHQPILARPTLQPNPAKCALYLQKKHRYCTQPRVPGEGSEFCGHHGGNAAKGSSLTGGSGYGSGDRGGDPRVPCPVDPSHTVYASRLQAHVNVCSFKVAQHALEQQPFYRLNENSGSTTTPAVSNASEDEEKEEGEYRGKQQQLDLARRIEVLYAEHVGTLAERQDPSPLCEAYLAKSATSSLGANSRRSERRHLLQASSIVSTLDFRGLLFARKTSYSAAATAATKGSSQLAFVELGAGRGTLALAINAANSDVALALVERSAVRNKADRDLRKAGSTSTRCDFVRARVDLRHFYLPGLTPLLIRGDASSPAAVEVVAVAKHLCGAATDLGLRSLLCNNKTYAERSSGGGSDAWPGRTATTCQDPHVRGVCIATCCHHRCEWVDYVAKGWFQDALGLGPKEFKQMTKWSSWACSRESRAKEGAAAEEESINYGESATMGSASSNVAEPEYSLFR